MLVTYNEIKYSMPVLAGAALEVADVGFEVDFELEVTSVVDGFTDVVGVLVDDVLVEEVAGIHWPKIVSREVYGP